MNSIWADKVGKPKVGYEELEQCVFQIKSDWGSINQLVSLDFHGKDRESAIVKFLSGIGVQLEFDIFHLRTRTGGNELIAVGHYVMASNNLYQQLNIKQTKFIKYVTVIQEMYNPIPYHNKTHAADVA